MWGGREGGRKMLSCSNRRRGKGAGKQLQYLWGFHIILFYFGGKQAPSSAVSVYSVLTKEDIDQKRH